MKFWLSCAPAKAKSASLNWSLARIPNSISRILDSGKITRWAFISDFPGSFFFLQSQKTCLIDSYRYFGCDSSGTDPYCSLLSRCKATNEPREHQIRQLFRTPLCVQSLGPGLVDVDAPVPAIDSRARSIAERLQSKADAHH